MVKLGALFKQELVVSIRVFGFGGSTYMRDSLAIPSPSGMAHGIP